jgi:hypothetical protein
LIGGTHKKFRLRGDEPQCRVRVGNFQTHFARDQRDAA